MMNEEASYVVEYPNVHKTSKGVKQTADSRFGSLMLCLGIVSAFLAASIIVIIRISAVVYRKDVELNDMMRKIQILQNQSEIVRRDRDDLSWTMGVILTFDRFPVVDFCRDSKCQPCKRGWILFQHKCYLFNEDGWFTWEESQQLCRNHQADLVVIDNLQEQEFINNRTEYYFDINHEYWLGLYQSGDNWIWVDGRVDSLMFWNQGPFSFPGKHGLLVPNRNPTTSWAKADSALKNRFICEGKALIRSK